MCRYILILLAFILHVTSVVHATTPPAVKRFSSADGSFTFSYPSDWEVVSIDQEQARTDLQSFLNCCLATSVELVKLVNADKTLSILIAYPTSSALYNLMDIGNSPDTIVSVSAFSLGRRYETPEPIDAVRKRLNTGSFKVNNRSAARLTDHYGRLGTLIALEVGSDSIVLVRVSEADYDEATILPILESMRYTPPTPVYSGNPDLPHVYSGPIGNSEAGELKFFYPAEWYVVNIGWENELRLSNISVLQPNESKVIKAKINSVKQTQALVDQSLWDDTAAQNAQDRCFKLRYSAAEIAEKHKERFENTPFIFSVPETVTVNKRTITYYRYWIERGTGEDLVMLVDMGNNNVVSLQIYKQKGEVEAHLPTLLAIAGTFTYTPLPCE